MSISLLLCAADWHPLLGIAIGAAHGRCSGLSRTPAAKTRIYDLRLSQKLRSGHQLCSLCIGLNYSSFLSRAWLLEDIMNIASGLLSTNCKWALKAHIIGGRWASIAICKDLYT
ncbi:hypothetical protein ARMSODRAFT_2410 [Armillaria solidipes]|uniref:Secreted protein n=1 Tax=Armillaria solidipes TaxID=1076256 RepID=A0A2H3CNI6_9AGAR|nr:hypothetical protein ARMSODRAFT_2410 [Armillaria solidipes]